MSVLNRRTSTVVSCILSAQLGLWAVSSVWAADGIVKFEIAAGDAADALSQFSIQSGLQMLFLKKAVQGHSTKELAGEFAAKEGLERLLKGTGLTYEYVNERTVTVREEGERNSASGAPELDSRGTFRLAQAQVAEPESTAPDEDGGKLPSVIVQGKRASAATANTASKMDAPSRDIPQSIQTISRDLIQDLGGLARLNELGRSVSGVFIQEPGNGGSNTASYMIRGFSTNFWQLVDGVRRSSSGTSPDLAGIERVEILKGPASVLYGSSGGSHGGLVNFVTKKPTANPETEIELTGGSYEFYRGTLDAGQALNDSRTVLFRVNAAAEQGHSFRDGIKHDTQYLAPTLMWNIGQRDTLLFQVDYTRQYFVNDWGWPVDPVVLTWPRKLNAGEPTYEGNTNSRTNGAVTFDHHFNERWKFHFVGSYGESPHRGCTVASYIADPVNFPNLVGRFPGCASSRTTESDAQAEVLGNFSSGSIRHQTLLGYQYTPSRSSGWFDIGSTIADLDVLNPQYGLPVAAPSAPNYDFGNRSVAQAVYAQDLLSLTHTIKLLLGARSDHIHSETFTGGVKSDDRTDSHFSPRAGFVFQPTESTALYVSYSNSFSPNWGRLRSGASPGPEQGVQYEAGLKQNLLQGKANLNVAVFELTKKDSAQCDPADPTCTFVVLIGTQRSRGLEIDLGGELTQELRVTASASFLNATVTADRFLPAGSRLVGAPARTFNLFTVYKFNSQSLLKGLELGGGVYYASETEGAYLGAPNPFRLPPVERLDAFASYAFNAKTRLQVNINNVTDRHNFLSNGLSPWPDQPREIFATLRVKF